MLIYNRVSLNICPSTKSLKVNTYFFFHFENPACQGIDLLLTRKSKQLSSNSHVLAVGTIYLCTFVDP